jgi:hypothetical protein
MNVCSAIHMKLVLIEPCLPTYLIRLQCCQWQMKVLCIHYVAKTQDTSMWFNQCVSELRSS